MFETNRRQIPMWLGGVALALVLIVLSTRGRPSFENPALRQRFVQQPSDPAAPAGADSLPQLNWAQLPEGVRGIVQQAQDRLRLGQQTPPLTPVADGTRLRVEISEVRPQDGAIQVIGRVTNISGEPLDVPVSAFQIRDSAGATYASSGPGSTKINPGASAPLDLTVPLPPGRGLSLRVLLPPDPPIEQVLVVAVP